MRPRLYPDSEYTKVEGQSLPPARLAQIQRSLPECDRLAFLHSLAEHLVDKVIELAPAQTGERKTT